MPQAPHENLSDCTIVSGWPPEWERRYQEQRHMHVDPVIRHQRGTIDPFLWREAVEADDSRLGMVVIKEARAFGLNDGLCVPFQPVDGREAGVSFGGKRFAPSGDERAGLHLVALYAMSTAKALARDRTGPEGDDELVSPLTERETECLRWVAAGKTGCDISVILSISRRTVEHHLANAARRLDAIGRAHCVAEAIRRGLIP